MMIVAPSGWLGMTNAGKITQMSVTKLLLTSSECPSMPQHLQIPAMMLITGQVTI